MRYYHGTFNCNIHSFYPFSHFGTLKSAFDVVRLKITEEGIKEKPYLFEVIINVEEKEILTLDDDWGTPRPTGLAITLKNFYYKKNKDGNEYKNFSDLFTRLRDMGKSNDPGVIKEQSIALQKNLLDRGIKVIKYQNKVEDVGADSLCVVDPACVQIINKREIPLSDIDL